MLTREENRWNFKFLTFCSDWNFLPISIDEKSGRISVQEKLYKLYIWYFFFGLECLHVTYVIIRFIQLLLSPNVNQVMDHVLIHSIVVAIALVTFWGHQFFIKRPRETVMIFNQLFHHDKNQAAPRKIFTWNLNYNRHELITFSIPFLITGAAYFYFLILLSDPDRMCILYSSVPAKFQHWSLFLLLASLDACILLPIVGAIAAFSLLNQLLFFQKCDMVFRSFHHICRNSIEMPRALAVEKLLKGMRTHFLYIQLFNRVFANIIFTWKQLALFFAIFPAFFAIRYNFEYPFTSIFAAYVHVLISFVYSLMYEKAFTIPENWRNVKSQLRVSANLSTIKKYPVRGKAGEFQKKLRRIPEIGVKVGDFYMLERESTPNFIGFVISSVTSLLITFR